MNILKLLFEIHLHTSYDRKGQHEDLIITLLKTDNRLKGFENGEELHRIKDFKFYKSICYFYLDDRVCNVPDEIDADDPPSYYREFDNDETRKKFLFNFYTKLISFSKSYVMECGSRDGKIVMLNDKWYVY